MRIGGEVSIVELGDPAMANRIIHADRIIHILPEQVASQIAAGEVVERPASAVKELVENSLDAGAKSISVEIAKGGCDLLSVADDGCGMGAEDEILSIRRHATSKIRDASDLNSIRTLGFRGEALASIASVARLSMSTRRAADADGAELTIVGGEIEQNRVCAMAPGTRIEVRELFFNTPARLKFLKTVATEQGAIAEAIQRLALANHGVAFSLSADGRVLFDLPRAGSLIERIRQLFGAKLAARMVPFETVRPEMRVTGFASISQESFPTPRMVFTFVNRRAVRDRVLMRATAQAYATLLPRGRHPAVCLFVELRPDDVDVNVHPMKTEVRFKRAGAVFELVFHALRDRLADQTSAGAGGVAQSSVLAHLDAAAGPESLSVAASAATPDDSAGVSAAAAGAATTGASGAGGRDASASRPLHLVPDSRSPARAEQRALGLGYSGTGSAAATAAEPGDGHGLGGRDGRRARAGCVRGERARDSALLPLADHRADFRRLYRARRRRRIDSGRSACRARACHFRETSRGAALGQHQDAADARARNDRARSRPRRAGSGRAFRVARARVRGRAVWTGHDCAQRHAGGFRPAGRSKAAL